jgi:uncharacterized protein
MEQFMQHGTTTVRKHCINVAHVALFLTTKFGIEVDEEAMIRGCLLHDYFLYDWHDDVAWHRFHGYHHARTSLITACRDFPMNRTEKQIIFRHMFPLNISRFPNSREVALVCIADKICATMETIHRKRYDPVLYEGLRLPVEKYMSESYSGRIIVELLQNADDAHSSRVYIT